MSDKKDKKRKRHDEGAQKSSWKKVAVDGPSKDLKISLFEDAELWGPILGIENFMDTRSCFISMRLICTSVSTWSLSALCRNIQAVHETADQDH